MYAQCSVFNCVNVCRSHWSQNIPMKATEITIVLKAISKVTTANNQALGIHSVHNRYIVLICFISNLIFRYYLREHSVLLVLLQQTACLVVNPIMIGNFTFLFNCTPVGRTSDSMMVPT